MDQADMYETLIGGPDAVTRRAHIQMQTDQELPVASKEEDEILVRLGFVLGGPSPYRKKFRMAALPQGWKIKPSDHRIYSHIVDEKGRRRAQIGYEARDDWTSFHLERRFNPTFTKDDWNEADDEKGASVIACITDSDKKELWRGKRVPEVDKKKPNWHSEPSAMDLAARIAEKKLTDIAPDWRSPEAYWGPDGDAILWPFHETPLDTRELYTLVTQCYDGHGNYKDGGEHAARKAKDDKQAKKLLLDTLGHLRAAYHEVRWTIKCGNRVIERGTERGTEQRPPRLDGRRVFFNDGRVYGVDDNGLPIDPRSGFPIDPRRWGP